MEQSGSKKAGAGCGIGVQLWLHTAEIRKRRAGGSVFTRHLRATAGRLQNNADGLGWLTTYLFQELFHAVNGGAECPHLAETARLYQVAECGAQLLVPVPHVSDSFLLPIDFPLLHTTAPALCRSTDTLLAPPSPSLSPSPRLPLFFLQTPLPVLGLPALACSPTADGGKCVGY